MQDQPRLIRFYFLLGIGILLGTIPFLIAWAGTDDGKVFFGTLVNVDDYKVYLSAIQQGREGYWLFHNYFTPEQFEPRLMHFLYLLIGKFAGVFGGENWIWYHASRLVLGGFAFWGFIFWGRSVFPNSRTLQFSSWVLISFGSGFGLLVLLFSGDTGFIPASLSTPEWNTITSLISSPHYIFAVGLLAVYLGALIRFSGEDRTWMWTLIASFSGLSLGVTYPYHIPTVGLITGFWLLVFAIRRKRIPWKKWAQGAIILLPLTGLLIYYAFIARNDPLWDQTFFQNQLIPAPKPLNLILSYGLLGILAVIAAAGAIREKQNPNLLLPILWVGINLGMLYLPIPFSGRFVLGLHIPIATLAAVGLEEGLLPRAEKFKLSRTILLWMMIPTTLFFAANVAVRPIAHNTTPFYYSESELEAINWLSTQVSEDDVIFANYHIGGYIPTVVNTKVFMGQFAVTLDYEEKGALGAEFWHPDTLQSWREAFVKEWGIDYIFQGAEETAVAGMWIELPWEVIYQQDGVLIYRTD